MILKMTQHFFGKQPNIITQNV